jgi:hypothetical protein
MGQHKPPLPGHPCIVFRTCPVGHYSQGCQGCDQQHNMCVCCPVLARAHVSVCMCSAAGVEFGMGLNVQTHNSKPHTAAKLQVAPALQLLGAHRAIGSSRPARPNKPNPPRLPGLLGDMTTLSVGPAAQGAWGAGVVVVGSGVSLTLVDLCEGCGQREPQGEAQQGSGALPAVTPPPWSCSCYRRALKVQQGAAAWSLPWPSRLQGREGATYARG